MVLMLLQHLNDHHLARHTRERVLVHHDVRRIAKKKSGRGHDRETVVNDDLVLARSADEVGHDLIAVGADHAPVVDVVAIAEAVIDEAEAEIEEVVVEIEEAAEDIEIGQNRLLRNRLQRGKQRVQKLTVR